MIPFYQRRGAISAARICLLGLSSSNVNTRKQFSKLPLPNLQQTLEKYQRFAKPFLTEQEFASTQKAVKQFISPGDVGEKLQLILEERYRNTLNWHFDMFRDMVYMVKRDPLPFYSNGTGQLFCADWTADNQLSYAAGCIRGLVRTQDILEDESSDKVELRGVKMSKQTILQGFHNNHFPSKPMDYGVNYRHLACKPTHYVVAYKNMFFRVIVRGQDGRSLPKETIEGQLKEICHIAETADEPPVGILTWLPRHKWSDAHMLLQQDRQNCESLDVLHKAGLIISIDQEIPDDILLINTPEGQLNSGLHGGGPKYNGANRWFDKLMIVINKECGVGVEQEHSVLDGVPTEWILFTAVDEMSKDDGYIDSEDTNIPKPKLLKFNTNESITAAIHEASVICEDIMNDTDLMITEVNSFGKVAAKTKNVSPYGLCMMAQQLAYFRLNDGKMDHIEDAAGMYHFDQGRTEVIRCSSQESIDLCKAMCSDKASRYEKKSYLMAALAVHKQELKEVLMGHGIDNHLHFLHKFARDRGLEKHPFFEDKAFKGFFDFKLSGTQLVDRKNFLAAMGSWTDGKASSIYFLGDRKIKYTACKRKSLMKWSAADLAALFNENVADLWSLMESD